LVTELDRVLDGRNSRLPAILERLRGLGVDIEAADVRRVSGEAAALGRPHVADALIALGVVADRDEAFARFLGPGGPAYVDRYATDLPAMIRTVADAGGVTVLAHPWASRHDHRALDEAGIAFLQEQGLAGLEIDHQDHSPQVRAELRGVARNLGLVETGSSDYHGVGKTDHDLACNTTEPDQFARLMELADAAAARSGARAPEVVGRA
jgi:predicted metal-dependent phosphoesterase TrpH